MGQFDFQKHWLCYLARLVLMLLGVVMGVSAAEHWLADDDLRQHYEKVGFGAAGAPLVAALQTIAAVGLLWPRSQVTTAFVLAMFMLAALASHFIRGVSADTFVPCGILIWSVIPAGCLLRIRR